MGGSTFSPTLGDCSILSISPPTPDFQLPRALAAAPGLRSLHLSWPPAPSPSPASSPVGALPLLGASYLGRDPTPPLSPRPQVPAIAGSPGERSLLRPARAPLCGRCARCVKAAAATRTHSPRSVNPRERQEGRRRAGGGSPIARRPRPGPARRRLRHCCEQERATRRLGARPEPRPAGAWRGVSAAGGTAGRPGWTLLAQEPGPGPRITPRWEGRGGGWSPGRSPAQRRQNRGGV